jgi:AraC-like DNA-binding protein
MTASTGTRTAGTPVDVPPWDLSGLRHERMSAGSVLPPATGPLWALVLDGAATLETRSGREPLRVGDAVLVDRRTAYRVSAVDDATLAVAELRPAVPVRSLPTPLIVRDFAHRHRGVSELVRACPLGSESRRSLFQMSYGGLIGASMVAAWLEDEGRETRPGGRSSDPAVAAVVRAITERPADPWTVERMARLVHLSRSALAERFRREVGRSPVRVLRDLRMQHARRLLADPSRSVEQVGHTVGYGSAAAFSRAFSAHHRMAPQAWREASVARHPEQAEPDAARHRGRRADEQRHLDVVRIDERSSDDGRESDRGLERRHLQGHR